MEMPDLGKMREMISAAGEMQEQMQRKLAAMTVEASSGGGVVTVRMNGSKEVLKLTIDPAVMGSTAADLELLEDLIVAAVNECGRRAEDAMKSSTQSMLGGLMGGLNLPGIS